MKPLNNLQNQLDHVYGMNLPLIASKSYGTSLPVLPTGIPSLNEIIGNGGLPRGKVIEVFGPPASGKTSLMLKIIGYMQKGSVLCTLIDAERAFDEQYSTYLGVDCNDLLVSSPETAEQVLDIVDQFVGITDLIVLDSLASLVHKDEFFSKMSEESQNIRTSKINSLLDKIVDKIHKSETTLIIINQVRSNMHHKDVSSGGYYPKLLVDIRVEMNRIRRISDNQGVYASVFGASVVKNTLGVPFKIAEIEIQHRKRKEK